MSIREMAVGGGVLLLLPRCYPLSRRHDAILVPGIALVRNTRLSLCCGLATRHTTLLTQSDFRVSELELGHRSLDRGGFGEARPRVGRRQRLDGGGGGSDVVDDPGRRVYSCGPHSNAKASRVVGEGACRGGEVR